MLAIYVKSTDPFFNLALEECLFKSLQPDHPGIFLVWQNTPSVIVGRHQNTAGEVDQDFCTANDIGIVRRSTGGGAVYHDLGNVNFSFITQVKKNRIGGFEEFMIPMVRALRSLGVNAQFSSRNDIIVDGRKLAGTAQMQNGTKILHHGCLLVGVDFSKLSLALKADPEKFTSKGVDSHRARVANLMEYLPQCAAREDCISLVIRAMVQHCASGSMEIEPSILLEAEDLARSKYRTWAWTWGNSPQYTEMRRVRFSWGRMELYLNVQNGLIRQCRICGDFFALKGIASLEMLLTGQKADAQSLRQKLRSIPLEQWFIGADRPSLLDFLCGKTDSNA